MTELEQKRYEETLKRQASAKDSNLNLELLSLEAEVKKDERIKDRIYSRLKELRQERHILNQKIEQYESDADVLFAKISASQKHLLSQKEAKEESIKLIQENKFNFELCDEVPYVESEQTEDLEDQEVFLDTWIDVRNRCNDLLFLSQVHGD